MSGLTCRAWPNPCLAAPGFASGETSRCIIWICTNLESVRFSLIAAGSRSSRAETMIWLRVRAISASALGLIASLKLTHLISPERLTVDYLVRLSEGIFFSAVVLDHFRSSLADLASYKVRWHEPVRALLARGPHRKIQFACLRGRRRGLELVASLN